MKILNYENLELYSKTLFKGVRYSTYIVLEYLKIKNLKKTE